MPETPLDLLTLDAAGFQKLYEGRIAPIFAAHESERIAGLRTFTWRFSIAVLIAVAVAAADVHYREDIFEALIVGGIIAGGGFFIAYWPLSDVAAQTKLQSLNAIAKAIGCNYTENSFDAPEIARFRSLELVPGCDRDAFEDLFQGTHDGCRYEFYDAHLERRHRDSKGNESWSTVFRGQLIRVAFPKKFLGVTIVRRDAGMFNILQRWATSLQRVGLGDSRLERAFEVYSNDQVEARYLIHPVFMERLLALEQHFKGGKLRCAFEQGDLLIAIEGKNRFEIGSMFKTLNDPSRAKGVVDDVTEIVRVVNAVLTAEISALPHP